MFEKEITNALISLAEVSAFLSKMKTTIDELTPNDTEDTSFFLSQLSEKFKKSTTVAVAKEDLKPNNIQSEKHFFNKLKEKDKKMFTIKDCSIRRRNNLYEVRFHRFGIEKSKSAKSRTSAIQKMQEYLKILNRELKLIEPEEEKNTPKKFIEIADYFMYKIKKPNVKADTFRSYESKYINYIKAKYQNDFFFDLTPMRLQEDLSRLRAVKGKTFEDVRMLLFGIFKYAKANGYIQTNPIESVYLPPYERVNGTALTFAEENELLKAIQGKPYEKYFLIMLFAGARPSEATATVIDWQKETITIKNAKLKRWQKEKYRELPLFPMLKPYETALKQADSEYTKNYLNDVMQKTLPNHTLKDLRHTFSSRAKECGINPELVNIWQGHSPGTDMTAKIYTHFSMEYQKKQAKRLRYKS
ncbi:MAG: hypothetical protein IJR66_02250 [Clostridia bacterium]|nr:hypothetical protein [Clostridia bacterium]MBQ9513790.1 hypothetical protein [Clostridia bacterium]